MAHDWSGVSSASCLCGPQSKPRLGGPGAVIVLYGGRMTNVRGDRGLINHEEINVGKSGVALESWGWDEQIR